MHRPRGSRRVALLPGISRPDLDAADLPPASRGQGRVTSCCGLRAVPTRTLSVTFSDPTHLSPSIRVLPLLTDRTCDLLRAARPRGPAPACRESVSPGAAQTGLTAVGEKPRTSDLGQVLLWADSVLPGASPRLHLGHALVCSLPSLSCLPQLQPLRHPTCSTNQLHPREARTGEH